MAEVIEMMDEAYRLFDEAEKEIALDLNRGLTLFRQGVSLLFNVYLSSNGVKGHGGLEDLFRKCNQIDPGFQAIESEVDYLIGLDPKEADAEELTDTANEIWDFMQGVLENDESTSEEY